jgi:hypothetical protein
MLLLATSLMAQIRTGNVYAKITDEDGNPLPGVTVTLTGTKTAPLTSITSAEGIYRFLSLPPERDYVVRAELGGFNTEIREGVIVIVGGNIELNITMAMGAIEEEVTVTAISPVVDTKKTSVGQNVTQEILQSLPTARDPWVILQMAPSVIIDRENIGGVESGQQSSYVARGASGYSQNVWAMDGLVITDPAAIGASPSYYDFDAFEEMQIVVGGADVTIQTGGVALNMITHRGGNRVSLGGRFYMIDSKFQATNEDYVAEVQVDEPTFLGLNLIRNNKDFGFNLGGPIVQDKAWLWGSYGVQDIKTTTVYQRPDDTLLVNYAAKLNVQIIPENRFEAFMHVGGKNKWGRSSSSALPGGYYQGGRYHFGSPIFKFQDEHMFGDNLFVSLKYGFSDAGFNLTPMDDRDFEHTPFWDVTNSIFESPAGVVGEWRYYVERPVNQYNFLLQYFNDNLFGASHDIKLGVEYADRNSYTESVYAGNMQINWNYNSPCMDFSTPLDGTQDVPPNANFYRFMFWRGYYRDYGVKAIAAYFSDTITFGRFNLILGVRYDYQRPRINPVAISAVTDNPAWDVADASVKSTMDGLLPAIDIVEAPAIDDNGDPWYYRFLSPRVGFTWDVTGDGKTIAKLSFAAYGDFMGVGSWNMMPGGASGWHDYWWWDNSPDTGRAADGVVQLDELYWHDLATYAPIQLWPGGVGGPTAAQITDAQYSFWGGISDFNNPSLLTDPYGSNDPTRNSNRTLEAMVTLEREIFTDFAVMVNATYRRYDKFNWSLDYFLDANNNRVDWEAQSWFGIENTLPADVQDGIQEYLPTGYTKWDGDWKDALDHSWYTMIDNTANGNNPSRGTNYYLTQKMPDDRYNDYYGVDVIFTKRLSNKWMLNANFTWQHQAYHYGTEGYINPTNIWAFEGQPVSAYMGGSSGKISQYVFSRWLVKASGLYQLPYDFNVSFTFTAREGWIIRERCYIRDYTITNFRSRSSWLYLTPFGSDRLNTFWRFDLRLEKMIKCGDTGRIYLMADLFNVFNSKLENRRYQKDWGYFYYYGANDPANYFREVANAYTLNEILNPRVVRLGVRFQF